MSATKPCCYGKFCSHQCNDTNGRGSIILHAIVYVCMWSLIHMILGIHINIGISSVSANEGFKDKYRH